MIGYANSKTSSSFSLDNAIIQIRTLIGSTICIKRDGKIIKKFRQTEAHLDINNTDFVIYLYSIKQKDFGVYAIHSYTNEDDENVVNITINLVERYSFTVNPKYYLFRSGIGAVVPLSYGAESNASISVTDDEITSNFWSSSNYQSACYNTNAIDLSKYSLFSVVGTITERSTYDTNYNGIIFAANAQPAIGGTHTSNGHVVAQAAILTGSMEQTTVLDISSVTTTTGYVGLRGGRKGTVTEMYLT